jgi:hypothetical protein
MTEEETSSASLLHKDLAHLIYEMCSDTGDQKPSQEDLDKFMSRLADELYRKFPHYKKQSQGAGSGAVTAKRTYKTIEGLQEEAQKVH